MIAGKKNRAFFARWSNLVGRSLTSLDAIGINAVSYGSLRYVDKHAIEYPNTECKCDDSWDAHYYPDATVSHSMITCGLTKNKLDGKFHEKF
jgi:hypothetical protein